MLNYAIAFQCQVYVSSFCLNNIYISVYFHSFPSQYYKKDIEICLVWNILILPHFLPPLLA